MHDPSHPLSSSASALCLALVSKATMVVLKLSLSPLVPQTNLRGFNKSSIASIASDSPIRLISLTVCQLISIERLGCDQMFSMETAFSGSSLSCTATQGDVKGVNQGGF
jgi:hypothetical protein